MSTPTDPGLLTLTEQDQLRELAARLEQAWAASESVDLAGLLPPHGSPLRRPFLCELIKADLAIRWQRRQPLTLECYLERYPELGSAGSLPADLLCAEYQARQLHGDHPGLATYRQRFPGQFERLQELVHQLSLPSLYGKVDTASVSVKTVVPSLSAAPAPAPPPAAARGGQVLAVGEGYTLVQKIGSGQFGEVFRGLAPGGVEVAIKRIFRSLDDDASRRELQSLELIKSLRHPFLLQTQAYSALEDRLVIVMELAEGSLSDRLEECRRQGLPGIPEAELLDYFAEAAEALDYLHSQQVVHRDIKPANLLRLKGHAKVADFGLARLREEGSLVMATFCGTPMYMAPEVWQGQVSAHSDQYSLAVTYAEMRLGRPLYSGKNLFQISNQHLHGAPNLASLGAAEQAVLRKALAKDPDQRYPSCRAFVAALNQALRPSPSRPASRPLALWLAALVGLLVVALAVVAAARWPAPKPPVGPPEEPHADWLPAGFSADEDAPLVQALGKHYHERIRYPLGDTPLVFLLIRPARPEDPLPFYIMRDKVSCQQFRAVMAERRAQKLLDRLAAKDRWTIRGAWRKVVQAPGSDLLPITEVTVMEAHLFAACVGGQLPKEGQWVKAGGGRDGAEGPFKPGWQANGIALNLEKPRPVGTSPDDVSLFGCRDMAGNGRELTRDLAEPRQDGTDPLVEPRRSDWFTVLGQSFHRDEPYLFKTALPQSVQHGDTVDDLSFRVVLEIPVQ